MLLVSKSARSQKVTAVRRKKVHDAYMRCSGFKWISEDEASYVKCLIWSKNCICPELLPWFLLNWPDTVLADIYSLYLGEKCFLSTATIPIKGSLKCVMFCNQWQETWCVIISKAHKIDISHTHNNPLVPRRHRLRTSTVLGGVFVLCYSYWYNWSITYGVRSCFTYIIDKSPTRVIPHPV
jgi:hypothetical protein